MAHILIVDDSSLSCEILKKIVVSEGHTAETVNNGVSAIEKLASASFDAAIIDLLMPEKDGFQVLRDAMIMKIKTPIIICSADIQETTSTECYDLGARGFIQKPIKAAKVMDALNSVIKGKANA